MKAFQYATALSTDSARRTCSATMALYLAGGNDLLGLLKEYLDSPKILVNIKSLPGLDKIEAGATILDDRRARDGRANRRTTREIKSAFPALQKRRRKSPRSKSATSRRWAAISRSIRAAGITAIATSVCLKKGGELCYARNGENRYHSLFTGNTCISPVVSSLATAFAALDATAIVLRDGKDARMSMAELYQRRGKIRRRTIRSNTAI